MIERVKRDRRRAAAALSLACAVLGCSPRVSIGDLGERGGASAAGSTASFGGAGGGVAGGVSDAGSAQGGLTSSEAGCAATLDQRLSISSRCPDAVPENGDVCEGTTENAVCVWQVDLQQQGHGYHAAGCYRGVSGLIWWGVDAQITEPFRSDDASCPKQAPVIGDACHSEQFRVCIYPSNYCECSSGLQDRWICTATLAPSTAPPVPVRRLCPSAPIDEGVRVSALTAAQARAWCEWYADPSGAARRAVSGLDSPGVADSYPFIVYSTPQTDICLADLPAALCARNLTTTPCTATLAELDDCVESIRSAPLGWVGHGCAPLLANESCAGIIVQRYASQGKGSKCAVPLE